MWEEVKPFLIRLKIVFYLFAILLALANITPVLADYLGPNRTVTQGGTNCKVILNRCSYVSSKNIYTYKDYDSWSCSNESKPWKDYPSSGPKCTSNTVGALYWSKEDVGQPVTITYPSATIDASLQNCSLSNGWCLTPPQLWLSASEPVTGYAITAIEGTLNGQNFACQNSSCSVPLIDGENNFTYWALSSWGDSSSMGSLTIKVDSNLPVISGSFSGAPGANGWYVGPVSFSGSASDATSGLASFTCTLNGRTLSSCDSISVNDEGSHTLVFNALDNAGNSSVVSQDISIDSQPPTLAASLQGTLGSNGWYNAAELQVTADDPVPGSGVSLLEYSIDIPAWAIFPPTGILDLPEGKHNVDVRATDQAGHSVSSSKSFWLDSVAPGVMLDPQGTLGANDWYVTSLSLAASASDDTSGLDIFEYALNGAAWKTYTSPLVLGEGAHNVSFWAQDQGGLVTQVDRVYRVDTVRPQIAGSISGTPGTNSWYVSNVTLSASASDPLPGSGVDAFTYVLDNGLETPYTNALTLPDGLHTIRLNVQDKAGLTYFTEQSIKVDTIHPSLAIQTTLPNWIKNKVTLSGSSADSGSGLARVQVSTDSGRSWKTATGTSSWNFEWDTARDFDGIHTVIVRAVDQAGLTTDQTIIVGVDNKNPTVIFPESWLQWETVTLDIWDDESGLEVTRLEISDPTRRYPKRTIQFDYAQFPLSFKWDRRFGDNSIAPNGEYDVTVTAVDQMGNVAHGYASVKVILDILPAGPTATPQPYVRATPTPFLTLTPIPSEFSSTTSTAVVSLFGEIQPTADATATPEAPITPRATPTQTGIVEWLESVLIPQRNSTNQITELASFVSQPSSFASTGTESGVLWGAAAAAMIGAVMTFTLEEKRKREAAVYALEVEEDPEALLEARKAKSKAKKMKKLEAKWAQERDWEIARLEGQAFDNRIKAKLTEREIEDQIDWMTLQAVTKAMAEEQRHKDKMTRVEEQFVWLETSVERQEEQSPVSPTVEKTWWQKSIDWIDEHQTEIAVGIGVVAGIAAIVLSGGVATPLVAAAWMAGAAAAAGTTVALGTIFLNSYYERNWTENIFRNVLAAGIVAVAVTGAGFLYQAIGGAVASFCTVNTNLCARVEPVLKFADSMEEVALATQLGYQTFTHDPGAADTALELHMELIDGGVPGNSLGKELSAETAEKLVQYGDEALDLVRLYGDDAIPIILDHGKQGISLLQTYGNNLTSAVAEYGDDAVELFVKYDRDAVDFIKRAEELGTNPTSILDNPPLTGQTLEGWLLGIDDPANPVNVPRKFNLTDGEITKIRQESILNPESKLFSIGYGQDAEIPFAEMANRFDDNKMSFLHVPDSEWAKYDEAGAYGDFWDINSDAIEWAMDERKIFVLNVNYELATRFDDPNATKRFTYAELQLIDKIDEGYTLVRHEKYAFIVPNEYLDHYKDYIPPELLAQ